MQVAGSFLFFNDEGFRFFTSQHLPLLSCYVFFLCICVCFDRIMGNMPVYVNIYSKLPLAKKQVDFRFLSSTSFKRKLVRQSPGVSVFFFCLIYRFLLFKSSLLQAMTEKLEHRKFLLSKSRMSVSSCNDELSKMFYERVCLYVQFSL